MITVNVNAPELSPKSNPEDMEKIKALYRFLDEHLDGLETMMAGCGCEKLTISVNAAEVAGEEQRV